MQHQPTTHATLSTTTLKTAITTYHKDLKSYDGIADYEMALRSASQKLLGDTARMVGWVLVPEQTLEGGIRPDGVMRDKFNLRRGYWEAKGPKGDLEKEITKKIANNYPLVNTIFENSKRAVLYQNKKRYGEYDLQKPSEVGDLLRQFFTYTEPDIANFEVAVQEFKERIPELAQALLETIEQEHKLNKKFIAAFDTFANLCRTSLDPKISKEAVNEMLVQILYPCLRVGIGHPKVEHTRGRDPRSLRPFGMKALNLEIQSGLSTNATSEGESLTKFAPQLAIDALQQ